MSIQLNTLRNSPFRLFLGWVGGGHSIDIRAFVLVCGSYSDWPSLVKTYARTCSLLKVNAVVGTHRLRNTF